MEGLDDIEGDTVIASSSSIRLCTFCSPLPSFALLISDKVYLFVDLVSPKGFPISIYLPMLFAFICCDIV